MNKEEIQKLFLRLAGALEILAFIAVVMPRSWMASWSQLSPAPLPASVHRSPHAQRLTLS
jgi:hypothetical protein